MYLTQKNQLRGLSVKEYKTLALMCHLSKNIYNVALYNVRQHYFNTSTYLSYESNYHLAKENDNYKLLQKGRAQQTMKSVDEAFKSFFSLTKLAQAGKYEWSKVKIPHYLPKDGYYSLTITQFKLNNDGTFYIPMSPLLKKVCGKVKLTLPERLKGKKIKEIRILPKYNARFFVSEAVRSTLEYVYEAEVEQKPVNSDSALSIDLGVNNLATCLSTNGKSFIIDGKPLKSSLRDRFANGISYTIRKGQGCNPLRIGRE